MRCEMSMKWILAIIGLMLAWMTSPGIASTWNNPHRAEEPQNIRYVPIVGQPKTLDPARAYSSDEYQLIAQIYEPPLQYHYLKRPYTLVPLTAAIMPTMTFYDANWQRLPANTEHQKIAYTVYDVNINPGIYYQPHPAFVKNKEG